MTRMRTTLGLLLTISLVACGNDPQGAGGGGGFGGMPPTLVEVATARQGGVADRFTVIGSLDADLEVVLVSEIAARIDALPFTEGEEVARGALIAQLDDDQLRAELSRAQAQVAQTRATFDRIQSVVNQNAGAPQDLDDARGNLAVAEADLALVRARLAKTQIRAPFDGVTGARLISPGTFVQPGEPITQIAQVDRLRVRFQAPERTLGRLTEGSRVEVRTTAYPDLVLTGEIDVIEPVLDSASRSAGVVSFVQNDGRRLRPGMSANVTVVLGERPDALTVPSEAIFFEGDQPYVYVVDADSTVQRTPVGLGTRLDADVEIVDGLNAGDEVVRAGHQKLFPGARVNPVHSQPRGEAGR